MTRSKAKEEERWHIRKVADLPAMDAIRTHSALASRDLVVRQRGTKIHPGENCGCGKDYTLFAKVAGTVKFHDRKNRKYCSIVEVKAE